MQPYTYLAGKLFIWPQLIRTPIFSSSKRKIRAKAKHRLWKEIKVVYFFFDTSICHEYWEPYVINTDVSIFFWQGLEQQPAERLVTRHFQQQYSPGLAVSYDYTNLYCVHFNLKVYVYIHTWTDNDMSIINNNNIRHQPLWKPCVFSTVITLTWGGCKLRFISSFHWRINSLINSHYKLRLFNRYVAIS